MTDSPRDILPFLANQPVTFSAHCRSGLTDYLPEGKCNCWRCRKSRGEPVSNETNALAAAQAQIADVKWRERMQEWCAKMRGSEKL